MYALHVRERRRSRRRGSRAASLGRDVEPLAEAVGLHAVGEPVVDDLGEAALRGVDRRLVDVEHLRRGGGVHVGAALERVDQPRVLGEVREHAQLDLRVVGGEQPAARPRRRTPAASRDRRRCAPGTFWRFGRLARDPPGGGVGLLERGVDATVGARSAAAARRRRCCAASRPRGTAAGPRRSGAPRPSSGASRRRSTARSWSSSPARARASRTGSRAAAASS